MAEVFAKHKQWKRAFLITDDRGTIVFANANDVAKYEEYLAQLKKEEEEKKLEEEKNRLEEEERQKRERERKKREMIETMQNSSHEAVCRQELAPYQPQIRTYEMSEELRVSLTLHSGGELEFEVSNDNPLTIWETLKEYVEKIDAALHKCPPLSTEIEMELTLH